MADLKKDDITYRQRWIVELFFKQTNGGLGLDAILARREDAVTALVYSKVVALSPARLKEITIDQKHGACAVAQLALVLVLARSSSQLITAFLIEEGITAEEYELRIVLYAAIFSRSPSQPRGGTAGAKRAWAGER